MYVSKRQPCISHVNSYEIINGKKDAVTCGTAKKLSKVNLAGHNQTVANISCQCQIS